MVQLSSLNQYLSEIAKFPLLNGQEKEVVREVRAGDTEARDLLIRSNLRLVIRIARSYACLGMPLEDLIQEGNYGLLIAVDKFDPGYGTKFSTYAVPWIKRYIQRAVIEKSRLVRISVHSQKLACIWAKLSSQLGRDLGRTPTEDEIRARARASGFSQSQCRLAILATGLMKGQSQEPDYEGCGLEKVLVSRSFESTLDKDRYDNLLKHIDKLPPRDRYVLLSRFGLNDQYPHTLEEVGNKLGITKERVRQIQCRAVKKLREWLVPNVAT